MVAVAQLVAHLIVAQVVVGSSPISHPKRTFLIPEKRSFVVSEGLEQREGSGEREFFRGGR